MTRTDGPLERTAGQAHHERQRTARDDEPELRPPEPGVEPLNPSQLTKEEADFLKAMYADWNSGRKITCWIVRAFVALGAVAGALAGLVAGWHAVRGP